MDFHGINVLGKNWLERVATKPVWEASFEGRIIYAEDTETLSFGTNGEWIDIASPSSGGITNPAVPVGGTLLFDSNVALNGYTLLVDQDDDIVYITKGSVAGGETGGAVKSGSTWTQLNHAHAAQPHTLTIAQMPTHSHPPQSGFGNFMSSSGSNVGEGGDAYGTFSNTGNTGGGQQHTHPDGIANAPASTWRPKGRNWTRQTKI